MAQAAAARYEQVLDAAILLGGWQFIKPRDRWSLYLMASYCYYELDRGLMPDTLFDSLCRTLLDTGIGEGWWFTDLWDAWGPWQLLALVASDIIAYAFASR